MIQNNISICECLIIACLRAATTAATTGSVGAVNTTLVLSSDSRAEIDIVLRGRSLGGEDLAGRPNLAPNFLLTLEMIDSEIPQRTLERGKFSIGGDTRDEIFLSSYTEGLVLGYDVFVQTSDQFEILDIGRLATVDFKLYGAAGGRIWQDTLDEESVWTVAVVSQESSCSMNNGED